MNEHPKIQASHLQRSVYVYVRQSTATQVVVNRESTDRQYQLVDYAVQLGWHKEQIKVVDEDLACSAAGMADRSGFAQMASEVRQGLVGIILCVEASRVARNNAEWHQLLDWCKVHQTLIGDGDGIYHPDLFNDRLVLDFKGTMAAAELHILRGRLIGGILNKAKRGELRCPLPVGLVWGQEDGQVLWDPDQAVTGAIGTVFEKFAEWNSVRRVWRWFDSQGLRFPQGCRKGKGEVRWGLPTYEAIHSVLTNPAYAGAYAFGKTRVERYVDESGRVRGRVRHLPRGQWAVLIRDHHRGFIDWPTFEMNQARIARNRSVSPARSGAVREGSALLQGLATCGRCGRRLRVCYQGQQATPGYYCASNQALNDRGVWCLRVGGVRIDRAVEEIFLEAIQPAGLEAALRAQSLEVAEEQSALRQFGLQVERAAYEAQRAERRYRSVEPENRLVARTLEGEWENKLKELSIAQAELQRKEQQSRLELTEAQREQIRTLGGDLQRVWRAATTTDRDRKELLQSLVEEVKIEVLADRAQAHLVLCWKTGAVSELDVLWKTARVVPHRTDEETVELVRRLARHHPDGIIASVLNRQGKQTATGHRFTTERVAALRRYWKIALYQKPATAAEGQLLTVQAAAQKLGVAASTLHRWLMDGFIGGEQETPGAPWRIRMNKELEELFVEEAPAGYVSMPEAMRRLGVSRQTVMQRVKSGELAAVHVRRGKQKGLRIQVLDNQPQLFEQTPRA